MASLLAGDGKARTNWTRDQLIVAFNLYCRIPFGRIHNRNPEIIALAKAIGRTPSAVSWKLANFSSLDPAVVGRNLSGATHGGKLEKEVWEEFHSDWNRLAFESERLWSQVTGVPIEEHLSDVLPEGRTREATVMVRVNQGFFRAAVLAAYDSKCCITGIGVGELLSASHIVPWSVDIKNRTNPRNGLCLNALHDRAFDRGLISIDRDLRVILSPKLSRNSDAELNRLLLSYKGAEIRTPGHFQPDSEFLEYHRDVVLQRI